MTDLPLEPIRAELSRGDEARRAAAVLLREALHRMRCRGPITLRYIMQVPFPL